VQVTTNGVNFAYLTAGDTGPLALCLDGVADSAHAGRHIMPRSSTRATAASLR
jgi:hypothetical protein